MERFVFRIQLNGVIAEDQPIDRLGIKNRSVEGFKLIVFNHNATLGSAVEILLLSLQVGNLRIDGDNRIGKLEQISQRVYKTVLTDNDMTAGTGLKPTVAIAAKQNSSPRSMVKQVILDDSLARGTEQRTACTVITDHIAGKQNFRSPCEVLYSETTLFINYLVYRFLKRNQELSRAFGLFFVIRTDRNDLILFSDQFHRIRTDKLHLITRASPLNPHD